MFCQTLMKKSDLVMLTKGAMELMEEGGEHNHEKMKGWLLTVVNQHDEAHTVVWSR